MRVGVLGPLVATDGEMELRLGGPKQRAVLALLVARAGSVVSVASLVDGVWGDDAPRAAEASLQSYVSRLRADVGLTIELAGDGYRLRVDESITIDAREFERDIDMARDLLDVDPECAGTTVRSALSFWRGRPFADVTSAALGSEVARLERLHRSARELAIDINLALGKDEAAVRAIDEMVEDDPFSESLRAKQMVALYRLGRQATALSLYQTVRRQLIDELGIEPGPELQDVERRILVHDPGLRSSGAGGRPSPSRNPYKGAEPFTEADAQDFFGRDEEVVELVELVTDHRLTLLVGPSGSGKSSLARAGLRPALGGNDSTTWATAVTRPGRKPIVALTQALSSVEDPRANERLVVIDQFEEIYSLVGARDRSQFIDLLLAVCDERDGDQPNAHPIDRAVRVLLTLRADFLHLPLMDGRLGPRLRAATMMLAVPSAANLAKAVDGPAANVGLTIEPAVTAQIVADVEGQAAALPLLQFTLTELAQTSEYGRIDLDSYRRHGGVRGAIGHRAASVYRELDDDSADAARRIFLHMAAIVDENRVVRRQVPLADLEHLDLPAPTVRRVLNRFGGARLLAFDHDAATGTATVELSHEAILQEWDRLAEWIDGHRQNLLVRRRFQAALEEWEAADRALGLLPDRTRLSQFQEWASDADTALAPQERAFLDQAIARFDRLENNRRRRVRLLKDLARVARESSRDAIRQRDVAAARALTFEAEANIAVDPELAIMLAGQAVSLHDEPGQVPSHLSGVVRRALAANKVMGHLPGGDFLAVDASGERLFTRGDRTGELAVWNPMTQRKLGVISLAAGADVGAVHCIGAERLIVRLDKGKNVRVVAVDTQWDGRELAGYEVEERLGFTLQHREFRSTAASPDGRWLAATWYRLVSDEPGRIEVWDLDRGEVVYKFGGVRTEMPAFSPDSRLVAYCRTRWDHDLASEDVVEVVVADVVSGRDLVVITNPSFAPLVLAFSPDQTRLAYASVDKIGLGDLASGEETWQQAGLSRSYLAAWSSDGERIATGREGVTSLISAADGSVIAPVLGHRGFVRDLAYVGHGDLLAIAGDERVALIDVSSRPRSELGGFASPVPDVCAMAFDPAGATLLSNSPAAYCIQRADGEVLAHEPWRPAPNHFSHPVLNRYGTYYAGLVGEENRLWSIPDMEVVYRSSAEWSIRGISDDGAVVVLSRESEPARLVDTRTGRARHALDAGWFVHNAIFLDDAGCVFTAEICDPPNRWRIWDTRSGALVNDLSPGRGESALGFYLTPDGRHLLAGSWEGTIGAYSTADLVAGSSLAEALVRRIDAHDQMIIRVSVDQDNRLIASNAWNEPAKVWELDTGRQVAEFGGSGRVTGIAFHPTDPHVYVHDQSLVSIHTLDPAELSEIALSTVTREMTDAEREQYFGLPCDS